MPSGAATDGPATMSLSLKISSCMPLTINLPKAWQASPVPQNPCDLKPQALIFKLLYTYILTRPILLDFTFSIYLFCSHTHAPSILIEITNPNFKLHDESPWKAIEGS
ncbi:hypothetical protein PTI98_009620 [Pleurotus ostreatus]|nr:hypothetical protein PTI98_009620 [Pleurotus ostreatus]